MTGGLNILGATVNINQRPQSTLSGNIFIYPVKKLINISIELIVLNSLQYSLTARNFWNKLHTQ